VTATAAAAARPPGSEKQAALWDAIDPEFLAIVGWEPGRQVLVFPQHHPRLGWPACLVTGCHKEGRTGNQLCVTCERRWKNSAGISLDDFTALPKPARRCIGVTSCAVNGCQRPAKTTRLRLCTAHDYQRLYTICLPLEQFLAHPGVVPLPSFGPCMVAACTRDRIGRGPYCQQHSQRFKLAKAKDPDLDVVAWRRTMPAVSEGAQVSLRGLPPLVVAEVIYGLQQRTGADIKTSYLQLRPLCDLLRRTGAESITALADADGSRHFLVLLTSFIKSAQRLGMSPETERHKNVWDLFVFGQGGYLTFTGISQPWLRDAAKRFAFDDLPRHRGDGVATIVQHRVHAIGRLSESLRLQRADHGEVIRALSRGDITAFCNRLAFLAEQGQISAHTRVAICRAARWVLDRSRAMGLTRPGEPLHGLPDDFTLRLEDTPDEPEEASAGRDLPTEVMRVLTANLDRLESASGTDVRVAVELIMDTGRRSNEIAKLALDCLERDADGKPVLIYDNHKAQRKGRRLPIAAATAALITAQQERVRIRFPGTPDGELKLIPAPNRNPAGRRSMTDDWIGTAHRPGSTASPRCASRRSWRPGPCGRRACCPSGRNGSPATPTDTPMLSGTPTPELTSPCCKNSWTTARSPPRRATTVSVPNGAVRLSTASRPCSSTGTATAFGGRPGPCLTPSTTDGQSARSPSPTEAAPSPLTSPRAAATARSGSSASAATTSAPTSPTCPN